MSRLRFVFFALVACAACGADSTAPSDALRTATPGTLLLVDGHGATVQSGRVTLTAYAQKTPFNTPEPIGSGPGIGVGLDYSKNPPDSTLSTIMIACVDLRLYTKSSGGTMAYSQNDALHDSCHGVGGGTSGPNGIVQEGGGEFNVLHDADVVPMIPRGVYYIRYHVTFPDSSSVEVLAGSLVRG